MAGVASAQGAAPPRSGQVEARQSFPVDIPAQALDTALTTFADQAGLRLLFTSSDVAGLRTAGVSGTVTAEEGLSRLLSGSGFGWRFTGAGSVALVRTARPVSATAVTNDEAVLVPEVRVQGRRESSTGPLSGYVAQVGGTGTRTDTPIVETPQSISVVPREQIETLRPDSITDALGYTPGIATRPSTYSRAIDDFQVRGFNIFSYAGVLRDGLRLQSNIFDGGQEPYGVERLELLRGPASVLYGQTAPGGVLNVVSKRPTAERIHEVNLQAGNHDRRQASFDFSGPLTQDGTLTYRLTALGRDSDTSVRYVDDDRLYVAPALTWRPDTATSWTFLGNYSQISTRFASALPARGTYIDSLPNGRISDRFFPGEPDYDRYITHSWSGTSLFEHDFGNGLKLRNGTRYFQSSVDLDYAALGTLQGNGRTFSRTLVNRNDHSTGFTNDASLEARFDTGPIAHTVVGGFDYYRRTYLSHRYGGTIAGIDVYDPVYGAVPRVSRTTDGGSDTQSNQYGLYLQDQLKLGNLSLLIGGRQDWADSHVIAHQSRAVTEQSDSAFTGRVGLVYVFDSGFAPYVSYAESFNPTVGTDRLGSAFEPTRGRQYEAGLRYQPPGTETLLSGAVFQINQENALTVDPVSPLFSVQTGEVRSRGVELEARSKVTQDLTLIANYTYTDARTVRSNTAAEIGQRVAQIPLNMVSVFGELDLGRLLLPGLRIGSGVRYNGESRAINNRTVVPNVPAYTLWDAVVSYDFADHWRLAVNGRNLTDKTYVASCTGLTGCRYGDGRLVLATLSYRW